MASAFARHTDFNAVFQQIINPVITKGFALEVDYTGNDQKITIKTGLNAG